MVDRHDWPSESNQSWEPVEVVEIQLKDVARTWWLIEEARLQKHIFWDQFSKSFYERLLPSAAKKEMKEHLIRLQQWNQSVDEYATKLLRLNQFVSYMMAKEKNRASRFQQGLRMVYRCFLYSNS